MKPETAFWAEAHGKHGRASPAQIWKDHPDPHRQELMAELERVAPFGTILELGCGAGPNLRLIRERWPECELHGLDISRECLDWIREHLNEVGLWEGDLLTRLDGLTPVDVVFSCYALAYVSPDDIDRVFAQALALAKKALVVMEPMAFGGESKDVSHGPVTEWAHDYGAIARRLGAPFSPRAIPVVQNLNAIAQVLPPLPVLSAAAGQEFRPKRKVAILGTAWATLPLCPFADPELDVWGQSTLYLSIPRFDAWFELHRLAMIRADKAQMAAGHWEWLHRCPAPLWMLDDAQEEFPKSLPYPMKDVIEDCGKNLEFIGERARQPGDFYTSSIAEMLALAIHVGYEEIGLYGVEMVMGEEFRDQREAVAWLIGLAQGRGIKVIVPANSAILNSPGRYGEDPPTIKAASPVTLEVIQRRLAVLRGQREALESHLTELRGAITEWEGWQEAVRAAEHGYDVQAGDLIRTLIESAWGETKELENRMIRPIPGTETGYTFMGVKK